MSRQNSRPYGSVFDVDILRSSISDIEFQMQSPDFWNDHERANALSRKLNDYKEQVAFWDGLEKQLEEFTSLPDEDLDALRDEVAAFSKNFRKEYLLIFMSGKYDSSDAIVSVHSGAGGVDAQDWASMLVEMYRKYCQKTGFSYKILHQSYGEQGGTKNATVEIKGNFAYGYLKGESGVHRLVRISPYSAKSLRHTSFALVDVMPATEKSVLEINPADIRVETFRSSGPGGQNVNKLETAVRLIHEPTGVTVAVQSERSQAQNKEKAMTLLTSRLAHLMETARVEELNQLKKESAAMSIEWGSQIRSYVLNPYKQVKDHRTGFESTQPEAVLEGDLDEFIQAEIQL